MHMGLYAVFCATSLLTISLLVLESLASPLPAPGRQCILNFCPNFADFPSRGKARPTLPQVLLKTNGQRLAYGLQPKPPMRRLWARKATPTTPEKRAPSPLPFAPPAVVPVERCGIVDLRSENGTSFGYVGQESFGGGLVSLNDTLIGALPICFTGDSGQTLLEGITINMGSWNLTDDFPLLGLIQGSDIEGSDIGPGSFNYLALGGIALPGSPPGSVPTYLNNSYTFTTGENRTAESSVWSIDINTGEIMPRWTNPNGTQPETFMFSIGGELFVGGDLEAFSTHFNQEIVPLAFHFEFIA
ncbi:hypothetical protein M413DRAFT_350319 [Hebeloma cylindrosporum]|uniref:Peptidase A1 domain-containing protein n=1 Tax=Hebeloma cylindrosporum TaxID=76867 RepID=A0A0C3BV97_HEBCY|nr:hypothetical protein M413DRAFT_350319 [Hebeloma cylindrosporum h7]